jgi:SAM-dependent methyltransferase
MVDLHTASRAYHPPRSSTGRVRPSAANPDKEGRNLATGDVPERIRWAVQVLDPAAGHHLLEIGCGPGVAVAAICQRLTGGRVVAIDRSATAIARATRRNADCIAAGRAVLRTVALEDLRPSDLPEATDGFDKIFAMNVNLFWVRSPARELELIRALLRPGGTLSLFYGYGTPGQGAATVPGALLGRLEAGGFATEVRTGPGVAGVVARPLP